MEVEQLDEDARGIVAPDRATREWSLVRFAPSPRAARVLDRTWVAAWSLPPGFVHEQRVLTHPVANLVIEDAAATLGGVATRTFARRLEGTGWALGAMFRPAGLRVLVDLPADELTDRSGPARALLGGTVDDLADAVARAADPDQAHRLVDDWIAARVPDEHHPCEDTSRLVERAAADPDLVRVDDLAERAGVSVRTLQRRFRDHVGVPPKWVLRRYRLYEAGERARGGTDVDWSAVAHDLGYSDQAHLVRDFHEAFGMPPAAYASHNRPDESPD
ncbi:helix-turn-helix domain-containing protein [Salsipaludibacter albus]|uniref:helix-turn-helix domain-containing protein n=1 Tax=Salsipaludibacter albus TaxID=2849650 RepID=UPI001EE4B2E9|nr:helix-turn-helix domain-containing protein [Salsipaludibacter albus]